MNIEDILELDGIFINLRNYRIIKREKPAIPIKLDNRRDIVEILEEGDRLLYTEPGNGTTTVEYISGGESQAEIKFLEDFQEYKEGQIKIKSYTHLMWDNNYKLPIRLLVNNGLSQ